MHETLPCPHIKYKANKGGFSMAVSYSTPASATRRRRRRYSGGSFAGRLVRGLLVSIGVTLLCVLLFALLMLALSLYDRRRHHLSWGVDMALGIVYLLLIALVIFLTCFSCHPLVGFNWRLLLFPVIHICTRLVYWCP